MSNDNGRRWYRFIDNVCIFGLTASILLSVNQCVSGNIESLGIWVGTTTGILGGAIIVTIWRHYAKKDRFVLGGNENQFRFRIWHFGLFFVLGAIIGPILGKLYERYPEINILNVILTFLVFGFVSFFAIGVLGIYWLQRQYGKRFYLAGQEG